MRFNKKNNTLFFTISLIVEKYYVNHSYGIFILAINYLNYFKILPYQK